MRSVRAAGRYPWMQKHVALPHLRTRPWTTPRPTKYLRLHSAINECCRAYRSTHWLQPATPPRLALPLVYTRTTDNAIHSFASPILNEQAVSAASWPTSTTLFAFTYKDPCRLRS